MSKFTTDEESMILTCMANGIPLCCAAHEDDRHAIIRSKRLRQQFEMFAHDRLGCSFDFNKYPGFWALYLENTIAWFQRIHEQDDQHKRPRGSR